MGKHAANMGKHAANMRKHGTLFPVSASSYAVKFSDTDQRHFLKWKLKYKISIDLLYFKHI